MTSTFTTVRGVPLAKVGDWPTYKGNGTITRQNLADAVAASQDPEIREALEGDPRGWLGHVDGSDVAAARQNEPAVGRVTNLTLSDDGDTLIGDVEDIPQAVVRHYPWRSVELHPNVETTGGKKYSRVLTGLAHLGRVKGAVRGLGALDDIAKGLGAAPVLAAQGEPILFAVGPTDPATTPAPLEPAPVASTVAPMTDTPPEPEGTTPPAAPEGAGTTATEPKPATTPAEPVEKDVTDLDPKDPPKAPEAPAGPETVQVSKSVWEQHQARLQALEADKAERETAAREQERDLAIAAAKRDGKISPADEADTVALFANHGNAAGLAFLKMLPKGLKVPTEEQGTTGDDTATEFANGTGDLSHLTPDQAAKLGYTKEA